ncbi:chemotaxis protein CheW [Pseudorhodoferax sp. LjRoot39]|uniref:chemotaxis protein CheW n=1 Tax=Pseudorhodoferax sp. LjRoot39 TaxID=3342328 RepID=UPI003ECE41F7
MQASEDISAHMHRVQLAERELRELGTIWRMIEAAAAISCPAEVAPILPTLIATRERFEELQGRLIRQIVEENRASLGDELQAQAQCTIDILVRNLFERTADVGFLATDDVVRDFCALAPDARAAAQAAMVARLAEYQAKYTVYDDIVLLAPTGEVLARLDTSATLHSTAEPLLAQALAAPAHVERYGVSDLQPSGQAALLYAHRILGRHGALLGVLVLRFRFGDEMQQIFASMVDNRQEVAIVLLDDERRVLATNDEAHVPTGARLVPVAPDGVRLTTFAGREYLAVCSVSRGYQGYMGPAWRAQAMVSLLTAFRHTGGADPGTPLQAVVPENAPALMAIRQDADAINRALRRVVWNGQLMAGHLEGDALRLKAVLTQINQASLRTRRRVDMALDELAQTSLWRARRQSRELARLAADILDRNLYERANDCRWWALSPALQQGLAAAAGPASWDALSAVLDHVNGLYTVYSRLVVFDPAGRIRGASRAAERPDLAGLEVPAGWVAAVQALRGSQQYAASDFADTSLHEDGPTYTYLAAVRAPGQGALLGGIAIVFHAAREFQAILRDVLGERSGFAAFVDAQGRVLARSGGTDPLGTVAALDGDGLVEIGGVAHACASLHAGGYREFKRSDGYRNGMRALVGLPLGKPEARRVSLGDQDLVLAPVPGAAVRMLAVFQVGQGRYALPVRALLEAVSGEGLVSTPERRGAALGLLQVRVNGEAPLVPVLCARRLFGMAQSARAGDGVVLVLRDPARPSRPVLGLRVDDVLTMLDVADAQVHAVPESFLQLSPRVDGLLDVQVNDRHGSAKVLLQSLDPQELLARTGGN